MGNVILNIFEGLILLLVFASLIFLAYVTTRYIGTKAGKSMKGKHISIVETVSLGMDKRLHLVKAGEQFVLIATTGKSVEFLTNIKLDAGEIDDNGENTYSFDFKGFFEKYLQNFKNMKQGKSDFPAPDNEDSPSIELDKGGVFKNNLNKLREITARVEGRVKDEKNERMGDK